MSRRALAVVLLVSLPGVARAQGPREGLATLIPRMFGPAGLIVGSEARLPDGSTHSAHFNSDFQSRSTLFGAALARQLTSLPLPSPASGFTYHFDAELGVFERTSSSFGPVFADRVETIGRGKFTIATIYQHLSFDELDGMDLGAMPAVFTHDGAAPGGRADVVTTVNAIDVSVDQFAVFATYGVTDRFDLSLALPIVSTRMSVLSHATVRRIGTAANPAVHFFGEPGETHGDEEQFLASDSASGLGDLVLRAKAAVIRGRRGPGLALGLDARLPTGREEDLLGSGALGLKPFVAFAWSTQRVAPHVNLAYLWNGESLLGGDVTTGAKGDLPDELIWAAGVDAALSDHVTLALDLLGRHVLDAPRLVGSTFDALDGVSTFPDSSFETGSFSELNGSVGFKVNVAGSVLLDVNLLIALDDAGLRDKLTPLVGFEYTF